MLWSFILSLSLILVHEVSVTSSNRLQSFTPTHAAQYSRIVVQSRSLMSGRIQRGVTTDVSCGQSPIQTNVTLKGGIEAGYFRKLAQHVAMQLCIELCCEEKGCDVAFMSGKNCYGVQCFNGELCTTLPAKKNVTEPVMISHVTFKGERAYQKKIHPSKQQCSAVRKQTGVTLHAGLKAGNFTDVGRVEDMKTCIKSCCAVKKCDVALLINQNCFLVSCYTYVMCEMVSSLSHEYQPTVAKVVRRKVPRKNASSLHLLETADNQLVCKNSQVFHNTTLKGGYRAGNYTNFGKVGNMSACVRLCCGNKDCDAALMLENNCFAVACEDSDKCLPVHAKTSSSLAALNPRISYITSRSEEVSLSADLAKDGKCHAGIVSYDVSLRGGSNAGNFTPHGKVGSMQVCIYKCCQIEGCSVAMMLKDTCFTVVCKNEELCEKKQTPTSSDFNPRIAYVFREKNRRPTTKHTSNKHTTFKRKTTIPSMRTNLLLAERLHAIANVVLPTSSISKSGTTTPIQKQHLLPTQTVQNMTDSKNVSILYSNFTETKREGVLLGVNNSFNTIPTRKCGDGSMCLTTKLDETEMDNSTDTFTTNSRDTNIIRNISSIKQLKSTLTAVDGDSSCTSSAVLFNVTLRNGLRSGRFKDRGKMEDIKQCVKLCCLLERCDLAFMLEKTCFSVECINRQSCDAVPAKSSLYSPTICYVYVKSAPQIS